MSKKTSVSQGQKVKDEWNPNNKESWHLEFEKELVNDDRWSCLVTAAVQAEVQADEVIQMYNQYAATGLRKAIKTITMADVISLLKGPDKNQKIKLEKESSKTKSEKDRNKNKTELNEKTSKNFSFSFPTVDTRIVNLATKYAVYTDVECKLPPDLMACIIKYLILKIKAESILEKKIAIVKNQRKREEMIKANLFKILKPYEPKLKENEDTQNSDLTQEPIDDEPLIGPDVYILMSDFYNDLYFTELLRVNVPFTAILRIVLRENTKGSHTSMRKVDTVNKKSALINEFWESLKTKCTVLNDTIAFKDILMMQYQAPSNKANESKQLTSKVISEELSWMQYSAYTIYRQHQYYLQELYVQKIIVSLEPLKLNKCKIYNKLCDALITGGPNTPLLVLYAIVEQVVSGVPFTESFPLECELKPSAYFSRSTDEPLPVEIKAKSVSRAEETVLMVPPCDKCRIERPCADYVESLSEKIVEKETAIVNYEEVEPSQNTVSSEKLSKSLDESFITESYISDILYDIKTAKKSRKEKKWVTPKLCFYGDNISLQYYHCDPRILNVKDIQKRFYRTNFLTSVWAKYPELPPPDRAFYNYHFINLWKISQESEPLLKLKIYFTLSMKLIGIIKSYLYKGEDENLSEMFGMMERDKLSKVRFGHKDHALNNRSDEKSFSNYFFKNFLLDMYFQNPRKTVIIMDNAEKIKNSFMKADTHSLRKYTSQFNIHLIAHRSIGGCFSYCFPCTGSAANSRSYSITGVDKSCTTLFSLLDCHEISSITEPQFLSSKEEYLNTIRKFHYFEIMKPPILVQRFLDAQENYNSIQCSYFPPTDTVILIMYNEYDYRGIFYTSGFGPLLTPVALRDFYSYVYPEVDNWLIEEEKNYASLVARVKEEAKLEEEIKDDEYLSQLKINFCNMSEEEKEDFLKTILDTAEITLKDLPELPKKLKLPLSNKFSFVTTNLGEVRLETHRKVNEYFSKDGTEVSVIIDSWLYEPLKLLFLTIKKSKLRFNYHNYIGDKINTTFTVRTSSDIIFVFYKKDSTSQTNTSQPEEETNFSYFLKASWPTGLMIESVPHGKSEFYIKQGYLKDYRKNWDFADEEYRCFLKNGQILIFKEHNRVDVLTASGAKHILLDVEKQTSESNKSTPSLHSINLPPISIGQYESTLTTGEVLKKIKGTCRAKIILSSVYKIYLGTDPKHQETFYKREDGVSCMLWSNGKMVTCFPDGTKITSNPDVDENEIMVEWTEEEKLWLSNLKFKHREHHSRSRNGSKRHNFFEDGFISISCSYLMEHPKYSSVYFNAPILFAMVTMPESVSLKISQSGCYEVNQGFNTLRVENTEFEFFTSCPTCDNKSTAIINLDSNKTLCKFADFFQREYYVFQDGLTEFYESKDEDDDEKYKCTYGEKISINIPESACDLETENKCDHHNKQVIKQRCFAIERDHSGYEFLQEEFLLNEHQDFSISRNNFSELFSKSEDKKTVTSHTFSKQLHKIGYENWEMEYEEKGDSLPTSLKKADLKEMGGKDNTKKLFEFPFPKNYPQKTTNKSVQHREKIEMPKVVVTRIIKYLSEEPYSVIEDLQKYVTTYQQNAQSIWVKYKNYKTSVDVIRDAKRVHLRLRKIALALSQNLIMYPHLCTKTPSTEKEIHYFGHFIDLSQEIKSYTDEKYKNIPDCKQLTKPLPKNSHLDSIPEESDFYVS